MSTRVCAASMEFLATPQSSGFPKVLWSPRSENAHFVFDQFTSCYKIKSENLMLNSLFRYEGQRTAEALTEYVNSEAGKLQLLV